MWGNKEGWAISAIIVALMGWMIWSLGHAEDIAKPSGQFTNLQAPIQLPVSPEEALPGVLTEDRDAGDQYRQAIQAYRDFPKAYSKFNVSIGDKAAALPAVRLVLDATRAKRAKIFIDTPQTLVNYSFPWPELDAIFSVGQIVNSVGYYYVISPKQANEALALKYLHASFSLGAKLFEERLTHGEMMNGIALMQTTSDSLRELAKRKGDTTRDAALKRFSDQMSTYYTMQVKPLYDKVVSGTESDVARHAGDVFELAKYNPDRMWRVEALLKVGRYKFEKGGTVADQMWANRLLNNPERAGISDLTKDPDPAVRQAATAAKNLTVQEFNQIR